jgi:hypothetical protein
MNMNKFVYQIAYYPSSRAIKPIKLIYYLDNIDITESFDMYNFVKGEMRVSLIPTTDTSIEYQKAVRNSTHSQIVRTFLQYNQAPI